MALQPPKSRKEKHQAMWVSASRKECFIPTGIWSETAMGPDLGLFLGNTPYEKLPRKELTHLYNLITKIISAVTAYPAELKLLCHLKSSIKGRGRGN